jgi:glycosyltransferase involved in cell wall biosynthesis
MERFVRAYRYRMTKSTALILFTGSFPFYCKDSLTEISFLQVELQHLVRVFHPLIIVPSRIHTDQFSLPPGIEVDTSYSRAVDKAEKKVRIFNIFRSSFYFREVLAHPEIWLKCQVVRYLAIRTLRIIATRDWILTLFAMGQSLDPGNTIFYTYWLDNITLGIGMAKEKFPNIRLVSRAHEKDLYSHSRPNNYFSYRPQTLHLLDRLFLISEHGKAYITNAFPWIADRCEVSRLGVGDKGILNPGSTDGIFRIASCSSLTPVKRVDLLVSGIAQAALERPEQQFIWNHFGDGPLADKTKLIASRVLPNNVKWRLHGALPNRDIIQFYQEEPLDLFLNVSSSEGIPVSIMEVACFGIPVMATAVGGTPEIVSSKNGKLLSPDPSPLEISARLLAFLDDPQLRVLARKYSRQVWQEEYDADRNYPGFANRLLNIKARVGSL